MSKKLFWLIGTIAIIAMVFSFSLAGCKEEAATDTTEETVTEETTETAEETTGEAPAEEITLTVWKGPHTDDDRALFADAIDIFEAEHQGVTIEYTPTPWDVIVEKYTTAFAAGNPPDIFYGFTGGYVDGVVPMCYDFTELYSEEDLAEIMEGVAESTLAETTVNGKLISVPWLASGATLVYNVDMLAAAGYDGPPDTLEEQLEMAKALTNDDQYGYGLLSYDTAEAKPEYFLYAFGCTLLNENLDGIGYDKPECLEAFKYINQLWNKDKSAIPIGLYPGTTMADAFFEGKFAMWVNHSQILATRNENYPDFNIGVALMPKGPGELADGRGTYSGSGFWCIPEDTKYPELAKDFVKLLYNPEHQLPLGNILGFVPTNSNLELELDPFIAVFAESFLEHGVPYTFGPQTNEVKEAVWNAMQALQSGAIGPEEAWQQAVDNGNAAFE